MILVISYFRLYNRSNFGKKFAWYLEILFWRALSLLKKGTVYSKRVSVFHLHQTNSKFRLTKMSYYMSNYNKTFVIENLFNYFTIRDFFFNFFRVVKGRGKKLSFAVETISIRVKIIQSPEDIYMYLKI